jgi:hypothetical protein
MAYCERDLFEHLSIIKDAMLSKRIEIAYAKAEWGGISETLAESHISEASLPSHDTFSFHIDQQVRNCSWDVHGVVALFFMKSAAVIDPLLVKRSYGVNHSYGSAAVFRVAIIGKKQ